MRRQALMEVFSARVTDIYTLHDPCVASANHLFILIKFGLLFLGPFSSSRLASSMLMKYLNTTQLWNAENWVNIMTRRRAGMDNTSSSSLFHRSTKLKTKISVNFWLGFAPFVQSETAEIRSSLNGNWEDLQGESINYRPECHFDSMLRPPLAKVNTKQFSQLKKPFKLWQHFGVTRLNKLISCSDRDQGKRAQNK